MLLTKMMLKSNSRELLGCDFGNVPARGAYF